MADIHLPDELWLNVFSYLPLSARLRVGRVCKDWYSLIQASRCCPLVTLVIQNDTKVKRLSAGTPQDGNEEEQEEQEAELGVEANKTNNDDDDDDDNEKVDEGFPVCVPAHGRSTEDLKCELFTISVDAVCRLLTSCKFLSRVRLFSQTHQSLLACLLTIRNNNNNNNNNNNSQTLKELQVQLDVYDEYIDNEDDVYSLGCLSEKVYQALPGDCLTSLHLESFGTRSFLNDLSRFSKLTELKASSIISINRAFVEQLPKTLNSFWLPNAWFTDHESFTLFLRKFSGQLKFFGVNSISEAYVRSVVQACTLLEIMNISIAPPFPASKIDISRLGQLHHLSARGFYNYYASEGHLKLSALISSPSKLKSMKLAYFFDIKDTVDTLLAFCQSLCDLDYVITPRSNRSDSFESSNCFGRLSQLTCLETFRVTLQNHPHDCQSCLQLTKDSSSLRNLEIRYCDCSCIYEIANALKEKAIQNQEKNECYRLYFRGFSALCPDHKDFVSSARASNFKIYANKSKNVC